MDERLHNPYYHYHPHHPPQPPLPQHPNPRGSVIVRSSEDGNWPGAHEPQHHGGHGGRHTSGGGGGGGAAYYLGKNDDRLTHSSFLGPGAPHHRLGPRRPGGRVPLVLLGAEVQYGAQYVYLHILNLNVVTPEFKINIMIMI